MSTEPEGQWAEAMERVRAVDPRNARPSWNRLAEMSGVSTTTLTMMATGRRRPNMATIRKVADALRLDADTVAGWVGGGSVTPYQVPEEVHLLTPRQQKALTELIRAIADEQTGGEADGDAAPTKQAGATLHSMGSGKTRSHVTPVAARTVKKVSRGHQARAAQDAAGDHPQD